MGATGANSSAEEEGLRSRESGAGVGSLVYRIHLMPDAEKSFPRCQIVLLNSSLFTIGPLEPPLRVEG